MYCQNYSDFDFYYRVKRKLGVNPSFRVQKSSVFIVHYFFLYLACANAEAAAVLSALVDRGLLRTLEAALAALGDVCLLFLAILLSSILKAIHAIQNQIT